MARVCLVTGAGGFIGSHLVERLVRSGFQVRALVRYTSSGTWGNLDQSSVRDQVDVTLGDIRDASQVETLMKGCDVVFHLAALIGIPYSYHAPRSYVDVNVVGTQNVLEAARKLGTSRVVVTSTSEVYGTALTVPIDEEHRLHPQSPYAASKVGADQLALSYERSFGTPVVLVRPFNTYGPRQSTRAIIPTIITQALASKDGTITLGSLTPERDLNYVGDTARGFEMVATAEGAVGQTFNLASGKSISIGALAERIVALIGKPLTITTSEQRVRPAASEVGLLLGDAERVRKLCGWEPETTLDAGLTQCIASLEGASVRFGYQV